MLARFFIIMGVVFVALGLLGLIFGKMGLFNLPGDLRFGSENFRVYIPITSCILISVILTLIFWLIKIFRG